MSVFIMFECQECQIFLTIITRGGSLENYKVGEILRQQDYFSVGATVLSGYDFHITLDRRSDNQLLINSTFFTLKSSWRHLFTVQHSSVIEGIVAFLDNVTRYADNQRTQDSRLHYLQMWSPGKQGKKKSTYIRFEVLRIHGFVLTVGKNGSQWSIHKQKYTVNDIT